VTDHYKRHFIRNKTDIDRRGIEPCRQRSEEPETSNMYHGRAFSK